MASQNKISCCGCDNVFDKYEGNFYECPSNLSGYFGKCKKCHNDYSREWRRRRNLKESIEIDEKVKKIIGRKLRLKKNEDADGPLFCENYKDGCLHFNVISQIKIKGAWMNSREREFYIVNTYGNK